jgi:cytochrome bd ubiquinol oxidase subunit I
MNLLALSAGGSGSRPSYHFLFVAITIGLAFLVAGFQAAWFRTGDDRWLRLTRFYGKLFLINFAMGVVTGIVQNSSLA